MARSQTMSVTHTSEACGCEEEKGKVVGGTGGGRILNPLPPNVGPSLILCCVLPRYDIKAGVKT